MLQTAKFYFFFMAELYSIVCMCMYKYVCVHVCTCVFIYIHVSIDGHWGCFHCFSLAIINNAAMNIGMYLFKLVFSCLYFYTPGEKFMGYIVVLCLRILRNLRNIFHSGHTNLHSHQQSTRFPFAPHPCQHSLFAFFLMIVILTSVKWYLTGVWFAFLWSAVLSIFSCAG